MEQKFLTKRKLPQYLVDSDYFAGLNDEEEFTVPDAFLKRDPTVDSCEKLHYILETIRFWGVHQFPRDVVQFLIADNCRKEEIEKIGQVLKNFDAEIPLLKAFNCLQSPNLSKQKCNAIALLHCAFTGEGTLTPTLVKCAVENGLNEILERAAENTVKIEQSLFVLVSMQAVVRQNYPGILRFLLKHKCRPEYGICAFTAELGRLDCLMMFHEFGYPLEERVINAAARHCHLPCLEFAHTHGCKITEQTAIAAAAGGSAECMQYVLSHGCPRTEDVLSSAARFGHVHLLSLLQERGCSVTADAVTSAASNGHIDCMRYLVGQGARLTSLATRSAATGGYLECLQFLREHNCPGSAACVAAAASAGHLNCLDFLLQTGCAVDNTAIVAATSNGHAHCLAALLQRSNEVPVLAQCVDIAAKKNKMPCLKLLYSAGVPLDLLALNDGFSSPNHKDYLSRLVEVGYQFSSSAAAAVLKSRNFDGLKFLCETKKLDLTVGLCNAAARCVTDLRYIKLLHQYNCPWDVTTCASAAACNNLACLTYLHEQGCPWDDTTYIAMMSRHDRFGLPSVLPECFAYALENGCPLRRGNNLRAIARYAERAGPLTVAFTNAEVTFGSVSGLKNVLAKGAPMDASTCAAAARYYPDQPSRSLVMLNYLHSQNCPWDERTSNAAAAHPTAECLQFVHERGCPWSDRTVLAAVSNGSTQCLQYLIQQGCPYDETAVYAAAAKSSTECLELLHRAGCRWSVSVAYAAANAGSLACLQYARQHKCPWDVTVSEAATQHPECLHYCVQEGCPIIHNTMEEYNRKFKVQ